jgi:hypothetical protein
MSRAEHWRDLLESLIQDARGEGVFLYIDDASGNEILNFYDEAKCEQADVDRNFWEIG